MISPLYLPQFSVDNTTLLPQAYSLFPVQYDAWFVAGPTEVYLEGASGMGGLTADSVSEYLVIQMWPTAVSSTHLLPRFPTPKVLSRPS